MGIPFVCVLRISRLYIDEKISKNFAFPSHTWVTKRKLFKMMMLALFLLALFHVASAQSAKCSGFVKAVDGIPNKCFFYYYQDAPMNWVGQNRFCQKFQSKGGNGTLFTPESQEDKHSVESTLIPKQVMNKSAGRYFLDYVLYTSISGDEHDLPESYQQLIYATYSKPNRIMPSGMWGPGEPNQPSKTGEPCTFGQAGGKGYGDCLCTWTLHSIICEFPSEN